MVCMHGRYVKFCCVRCENFEMVKYVYTTLGQKCNLDTDHRCNDQNLDFYLLLLSCEHVHAIPIMYTVYHIHVLMQMDKKLGLTIGKSNAKHVFTMEWSTKYVPAITARNYRNKA